MTRTDPAQRIHGRYIDAERKVLNPFRADLAPEVGDRAVIDGSVKSYDPETREIEAVISSPTMDRHREIVLPSAFTELLPRFMANPVMLAHHESCPWDTGEPTSIGQWTDIRIGSDEQPVIGRGRLLSPGDDLADKWARRFDEGVQRAFSIGFIVHEWEMREFGSGENAVKRRVFTKIELVEVSAVHIPANYDAVMMAASHDGAGAGDPLLAAVNLADEAAMGRLADALAPKLAEAIDLNAAARAAFSKLLDGDPDGPMARLFLDCCQAALDRSDPMPDGHRSGPDPDVSAEAMQRLAEVNRRFAPKGG